MTTIWHNPRCSKSRQALKLLQERGVTLEIRRYLDDPPTRDELKEVLGMLGYSPRQLMRTKEKLYKELNLAEITNEAYLVDAMVDNPRLIERPVIMHGGRAVVGRPPENVTSLFDA